MERDAKQIFSPALRTISPENRSPAAAAAKQQEFCEIRQFAARTGARFVQNDGKAVPFSSIHRKSCRFFVNFGYCFFLQNRV
jgi:hypothetical protein